MCKFHKNSGFTLIEIMISIAIIAIGIFAVMSLIIIVMKGNTLSKRVTTATTIAQEKMEDFKRMGYDKIDVDVDVYSDTETAYDIDYYHKVTVTPDDPAIDTKTIGVGIFWNPPGTTTTDTPPTPNKHNVELKTIIAK